MVCHVFKSWIHLGYAGTFIALWSTTLRIKVECGFRQTNVNTYLPLQIGSLYSASIIVRLQFHVEVK